MPDIVPAGIPRKASDVDGRRRTLADQELINSLGWLVSTRWFAGFGVMAAAFVAAHLLALPVPEAALYGVGLFILVYNAALFRWLGQLERSGQDSMEAYARFARAQIGLDWLGMTVLTALSGGIESPVIIFFLFHISIAALLLPHARAFLYVALAPGSGHPGRPARVRRRHSARGAVRPVPTHAARFRRQCPLLLHGGVLSARLPVRGDCGQAAAAGEGDWRPLRERARYDRDARPRNRAQPPGRVDDAGARLQGRGDPAARPDAQAGGVRGDLWLERRVRGAGAAGLPACAPRPGDAGRRAAVRHRRGRRPADLEPEARARGRDRVDAVGAAGRQERPPRRAPRLRRRRLPVQRRRRGVPGTRGGTRRGGHRERAGLPDARGSGPREVAVRPRRDPRTPVADQRDREPADRPRRGIRGRPSAGPSGGHPAGAEAGAGAEVPGERPPRPGVGQGGDEGGRSAPGLGEHHRRRGVRPVSGASGRQGDLARGRRAVQTSARFWRTRPTSIAW